MPALLPARDGGASCGQTARGGDRGGSAERLASYVSPLITARIARDGRPIDAPFCEHFSGAMLDVDIVGFTGLTERLETAGQVGVEQLSRLLNDCFARFIEVIDQHGGSVLEFLGDGIVTAWRAAEAGLGEATRAAARCAAALQQTLADPAINEAGLSLHIGIGAGEFSHTVLGGRGERWMSVIGGDAREQARAAAALSPAGDFTVSAAAWRFLGGCFEAAPESGGAMRITGRGHPLPPAAPRPPRQRPPCDASALRRHVAPAIRQPLPGGRHEWLAEFRRVTVLFINLPELSSAAEGWLERAQGAVEAMQHALADHEADLEDLVCDSDGLTGLAAAGLPPLAHEDDPLRAVRSALAMQRELRGRGLRCAIGVTTGSLFCGSLGNAVRRNYSMLGDAINRCARLARLAADDVLCDEPTRLAASKHLQFTFAGAPHMRGKTQAVAVFRPAGEPGPHARPGVEIIGRESERRQIRERLEGVRASGRGGLLLIEGEAGIGKTTLVSELLEVATAFGLGAWLGCGDSVERTSSYFAWRPVFKTLFELSGEDEPAQRAAAFSRRFADDPELSRLAPLLNPLTGLSLPENEITGQMNAQSRAEATLSLLVRLLGAANRAPAVIVLEDCQWLDSASWTLALEVRKRLGNILLVMVARTWTSPAPEEWEELLRTPNLGHLRLTALPEEEALLLVRRRLGVEELPEAVRAMVNARAEGHPFFCEELAFTLRDAGFLVIEGGRCRLSAGAGILQEINLPDTVHGVIRERIDRLSAEERLAIKTASVIGRDFSLETLREIYPGDADRDRLPESLDRLVEVDLALAVEAGGEAAPVYRFKHALTQEAAYMQMLPSQRRSLHAALAAWIERTASADLEGQFPLLAHHWTRAEVQDKAVDYLGKAGEQALARFANREAVAFLEKAISLSDSAGLAQEALSAGRRHRQLGEGQFHLGRMEQSRRHLERAVALLGYPVPSRRLLTFVSLPCSLLAQAASRLRGGARVSRDVQRRARLCEAVNAYNCMGEMAYFTNDLVSSFFSCIHGLNLAERAGPSPKLAEMFASALIVAAAVPPLALGAMYMKLVTSAAASVDQPVTRAYILHLVSMYLSGLGEWQRAREVLAEAQAIYARFDNRRRLEESLLIENYIHLHEGRLGESRRAIDAMLLSARQRDDAQSCGWGRMLDAQLALCATGGQEAIDALGEDPAMAQDGLTAAGFYALSAAGWLRVGNTTRARDMAESALGLLAAVPPVAYTMLLIYSYTAEVCLTLLAQSRARGGSTDPSLGHSCERACGVLRRFARVFPIGEPRARLWSAVHHALRGRSRRAEADWRRGLAAAERLGMPQDAAQMHFWRSKLGPPGEREAEFAKAAAIFESTGAGADLARLRSECGN